MLPDQVWEEIVSEIQADDSGKEEKPREPAEQKNLAGNKSFHDLSDQIIDRIGELESLVGFQ